MSRFFSRLSDPIISRTCSRLCCPVTSRTLTTAPINSKWTCSENHDGSLIIHNNVTDKYITIRPDCAQYGCQCCKPYIQTVEISSYNYPKIFEL